MNRKAEQILKVDVTGRVWTPRELREAALDEFEGNGMPGTKLAERIGVKYSTFASWVQGRRREGGCASGRRERRGKPAALKWVEAVAKDARFSSAVCGLVVHLPGGVRMEIAEFLQMRPGIREFKTHDVPAADFDAVCATMPELRVLVPTARRRRINAPSASRDLSEQG